MSPGCCAGEPGWGAQLGLTLLPKHKNTPEPAPAQSPQHTVGCSHGGRWEGNMGRFWPTLSLGDTCGPEHPAPPLSWVLSLWVLLSARAGGCTPRGLCGVKSGPWSHGEVFRAAGRAGAGGGAGAGDRLRRGPITRRRETGQERGDPGHGPARPPGGACAPAAPPAPRPGRRDTPQRGERGDGRD